MRNSINRSDWPCSHGALVDGVRQARRGARGARRRRRPRPAAAAPADDKGPIKVGILHSLSGTMAISETSLKDVALMTIEEINEAGGVLGRKLEPVVVDPASNWPLFAEKARDLIQNQKVAVTFGCWTSVSRKSVLPVFEELNGLLFYPVQYEGEESSCNVFYTGAAPNQQAIPAVEYLMGKKGGGAKRFVLLGTDYVYPRTTNKILRYFLHSKGVADDDIMEKYTPFGHSDYQTIVADIKKFAAGKRTAVISTINGDSNVPFYKELANQGIKATDIPVVAFSVGEEELRGIDTKPLVGQLAAWNYFESIDNPTNKAFIDKWMAYVKKNNLPGGDKRVTNDPMEATYIGIHMWAQAVEQAHTTNVDAVRQAIGYQHFKAPSGFDIEMDAKNHHLHKPVYIGEVKADGQFHVVWKTDGPDPRAGLEPVHPRRREEGRRLDLSVGVRQLHGAEVRAAGGGRGEASEAPRRDSRRTTKAGVGIETARTAAVLTLRWSSLSRVPSLRRPPTPASSRMPTATGLASLVGGQGRARASTSSARSTTRGVPGARRADRRSPARGAGRPGLRLGQQEARRSRRADAAGGERRRGRSRRSRSATRSAAWRSRCWRSSSSARPTRRCGSRPPRSWRRAARPRRPSCFTGALDAREATQGARRAGAGRGARRSARARRRRAPGGARRSPSTGNDEFLADAAADAGSRRTTAAFAEPDARVRAAARRARRRDHGAAALRQRRRQSALRPVSLASVLLFAALGLAVTFGLLGVINMAHGEMLMLGAYSTYAVQTFFQKHCRARFAVPAGGGAGRVRRDHRRRRAPRAHRHPLPLRAAARDAARDLGHQPAPHPDRALDLRRAERRRRQPRLARGRRRDHARAGAALQPRRRRRASWSWSRAASGSCCSGRASASTCAP